MQNDQEITLEERDMRKLEQLGIVSIGLSFIFGTFTGAIIISLLGCR